MENGDIPDSNLAATVNSYENNPTMFGAHRARLNSPSGYRADSSALSQNASPFILVQLPKEMIITGVATQGLGKEWVTKYRLLAADDGGAYVFFRDVNTPVKVRSIVHALMRTNASQDETNSPRLRFARYTPDIVRWHFQL